MLIAITLYLSFGLVLAMISLFATMNDDDVRLGLLKPLWWQWVVWFLYELFIGPLETLWKIVKEIKKCSF